MNLKVCTHQLLGGMWNISTNVIYFTIQLEDDYFTKKTGLQWISAVIMEVSTVFQIKLVMPLLPECDCNHDFWLLFLCSCSAHHLIWSAPECLMQLCAVWPLKEFLLWSTVTMKGSEKQRGQSSWMYLGLRIKRGFESLTSVTLLLVCKTSLLRFDFSFLWAWMSRELFFCYYRINNNKFIKIYFKNIG